MQSLLPVAQLIIRMAGNNDMVVNIYIQQNIFLSVNTINGFSKIRLHGIIYAFLNIESIFSLIWVLNQMS